MSDKPWTRVTDGLPPADTVVETKQESGGPSRHLKLRSLQWVYADGTMTGVPPTHWREADPNWKETL